MNKDKYNIAIVGATGAVGSEFLSVLEKRNFPIANLKLLASKRSAGKTILFKNKDYIVEELTTESFSNIDIALFSAGGDRAKEFAPAAVKAGAIVIDNSSAFRMDSDVPLIVPEVNPEAAKNHKGIIANPNCTTIIMCVALAPIHKINPVKRIIMASYQAVSGAGAMALEELKEQQKNILEGNQPQASIFKHVIANNVFSHDSDMQDNGYNQEEMKMVHETRKIFSDNTISISPTCIRVPIYRAHSEALHMELTHPVHIKTITEALQKAPGLKIIDDNQNNYFPMPLDASFQDDVLVGRIRKDLDNDKGLNIFICGDQLLKGAALNAVQIAELLI
ncbi:MAG: aspartate-semialdehyde dehydrogenase [bacterium]|nr:aspartate-semialdehyde dehydrogenase [bacterium]